MNLRMESIKWFLDTIPSTATGLEATYRSDVEYLIGKVEELSEKLEALNTRLEWEDWPSG